MSRIRLNFSISEKLYADLLAYCEGTGRSGSDLIRQLILELLDGERSLSISPTSLTPDVCAYVYARGSEVGSRSSLMVMEWMYGAFEEMAHSLGITKSALISELLTGFLAEKRQR